MVGRYKGFHYYNAGTVFETLMAIFRPMISKKLQDRVRHCGRQRDYLHE